MRRPDGIPAAPARTLVGEPSGPAVPARLSRSWLQPLRIIGVVLPVLFVVALQVLRPTVVDVRWPANGDLVVTMVTVVATVFFGVVMFDLIERAHAATLRQNRELSAVNRVLVEISQQDDPGRALATVVRLAGTVPGAASAGLCLEPRTAAGAAIGRGTEATATLGAPLCVTGEGLRACRCPQAVAGVGHAVPRGCPGHDHPVDAGRAVVMALHGPDRPLGQIWVAPRPGCRIGVADEAFLSTLAELAVVALRHARLLENERGAAVVAERDRIAREMHDSLAQVLGATHLRLRALAVRPELVDQDLVRSEINDIAGTCHDAYADVREAILGLRASTRTDAGFLDSLDSYVRQFSRQSCIPTRLEADTDELSFAPHCEVQVLRVVQEALTNVRKHSGASGAVVRVRGGERTTVLEVEDNGRGFDPVAVAGAARGHFGLASMQERAALVDGQLAVDSRPGEGTRVAVTIPETMRMPRSGGTGWRP